LLARAANVSLREGHAERASSEAGAAHALLEEHGVPEYVVIVELSYAEALRANGDERAARRVLDEARSALELRACEISEPALRHSFLEQVSEHAHLRKIAAAMTGRAG